MKKMKFLIIGLGSMGKRRIRNLQHLKAGEIIGYEPNKKRADEVAKEYDIRLAESFDEGLAWQPDAVIISTPPDKHMEYALYCARFKIPFFAEASVIIENGFQELVSMTNDGAIGMPSCTMRFFEPIQKIKEIVNSGKLGNISNFTYTMGQWLPDWHTNENIKDFYVGKKETGGCREMIPFETEWINWVFGKPIGAFCIKGKTSKINADIDDTYSLMLDYGKFCGQINIDVVARKAIRQMRITGDDGILLWDWEEEKVSVFDAKTKKWTEYKETKGFRQKGYLPKENMYISEMKYFIECVKQHKNPEYTFTNDLSTLDMLERCEYSSDQRKYIYIGNIFDKFLEERADHWQKKGAKDVV